MESKRTDCQADRDEGRIIPRPKIVFEQLAWMKMRAIIDGLATEVGWHGTVERCEDTFRITDILFYPQTVTGATITTDETEYTKWRDDLPDEQFTNLRFHGHSHVNMGVSPSGVDRRDWNKTLEQLPSVRDDNRKYYIFAIFNKSLDIHLELYDASTMIKYSEAECDIMVEGIGDVSKYIGEVKDKYIKRKEYKYESQQDRRNFYTEGYWR